MKNRFYKAYQATQRACEVERRWLLQKILETPVLVHQEDFEELDWCLDRFKRAILAANRVERSYITEELRLEEAT